MVKVCSYNYPKDNETQFKEFYERYPYPLHDFQKWAVQAIVEGNHVLVTAPTGSGKTMPGDFALDYFHSIGKKTIYCSPIKALSNQKFYDFTHKYKDISIGLITGDIKTNPDANVLIMTTEILLNKLYQINSKIPTPESNVSFEMDIYNELGCVIFDEIHMINDASRGHVWENCIMLLPRHIQMIGLSATLDNPERFAYWLENRGEQPNQNDKNNKIVYLTSKTQRAVPLTHYSFITATNGVFKTIKDKVLQEEIKQTINKPNVMQDSNGKFNEENYLKIHKILQLFEKNDIRIKRQHALNQVSKYLVENEMLPAVCYVFSRKQVEICASEVTTNLLEFDSKVPYTIDYECEQIIRKLPNYKEYLHLPEYIQLVQLLRKGIAIHHAGLLPVLREIVELLFAKGYIKLLFCTETISVGLNLPVKTTIFTDVNKFDGNNHRILYGHEYTQAAGRAGRLGLDKVGHSIHLNNLFRNVDSVSYKTMLKGKPQTLISKFKVSFNLLLNLIDIGDNNFIQFARRSMVTTDIDSQLNEVFQKINDVNEQIDKLESVLKTLRTPRQIVEDYIEMQKEREHAINKKRKELDRKIENIVDNYKFVELDKQVVKKYIEKKNDLQQFEDEYKSIEKYIDNNVNTIIRILQDDGYVDKDINLTLDGTIGTHLREVHCLVFAKILSENKLDLLTPIQIVSLLSCFTNVSVPDDKRDILPQTEDVEVKKILYEIVEKYQYYQNKELYNHVDTGTDYYIQYDIMEYVKEWCKCENVEDCKILMQKMEKEKQIFLGEFVKAVLKINNISSELEKIAEFIGNMNLLSKLKEIPNMTLKYVVTNQSLYV
jgi:superfamily II RNA helicase